MLLSIAHRGMLPFESRTARHRSGSPSPPHPPTRKENHITKKTKTTKTTTESTPEQKPPELMPRQKYEQQLQQILDAWPEKALKLLEADVLALEAPEGARKIKPQTSERTLRTLRTAAAGAVKDWVVLPSRPPAAVMSRQKPNKESIERAEQRRRIEKSYVYTVDMRRIINEDRQRAGLPPLPPPEDEALTSDKQE